MTASVTSYPEFLHARIRRLIKSKRPSGVQDMVDELAEACSEPWCELGDIDYPWALLQLIDWLDSL